jgi:glyoxylase-like metal-dependent hydrolase (beta-lactamase superfamily II)
MSPPYVHPLPGNIWLIDTGFERDHFDAAYLVVDSGRAAFVDTGPNPGIPRLLAALDALEVAREAVDWIIPTHVHLDHAGGCGLLAEALPNAKVLVHPRGEAHLIDPSALYAGALAVYGQAEMDRSYGQLVPVDATRTTASADGQHVLVGRRLLEVAHTPGHARHHHCIWDAHTNGWFTGDTFGLSYREFDVGGRPWILPSSTPVQFEPDALRHSIGRMMARAPQTMYLTHYGAVKQTRRLAELLLTQIDEMVAMAHQATRGEARHAALAEGLVRMYEKQLARHGWAGSVAQIRKLLAVDIELNAQGLAIWLDRSARAAPSA